MESQFDQRDALKAKRSARDVAVAIDGNNRMPLRGHIAPVGNAAKQRILRAVLHRAADGVAGRRLDESVAGSIAAKRRGGQALDPAVGTDLGAALAHDFSDVRVHTDGEADQLNRAVEAEAFTTGTDIFFRQGNYDPGSAAGRKLLAHELTHVVQQRGAAPSGEMRVSSPDDASERQASAVAEHVVSTSGDSVGASIAREEVPEEEMQASPAVAREAAPEEEELQTNPVVPREASPDDDELQGG